MYAIIFHAHQKLDRVARRHLTKLMAPNGFFPSSKQITHFEGPLGPDGTKLKRADHLQPWHFIDPKDPSDTELDRQIQYHYDELVKELRQRDEVRAGFQAAWLAHALVDGLTPAHHYPYEKELEELRGQDKDTRKGLAGRAFVKGNNMRDSIKKSLKVAGPRGLLTSHAMFEGRAYKAIVALRLSTAFPSQTELEAVLEQGVVSVFKALTIEIASYKIYDRYLADGWTRTVNSDVKEELAPRMVRMITLAWYAAYRDAARA